MTTSASRARERFVAEGACGGQYAIVWDRERQQIVFPYLRTGASVSDDQIRAVAGELDALLAVERAEALEEAAKLLDAEEKRRRHFKVEDGERRLKNAEVMWQMGADWAEQDAAAIRELAQSGKAKVAVNE